jgi:hypothetical protein
MTMLPPVLSALSVVRADDSIPPNLGITVNFSAFPFMAQLQEWAGGIQAVCLILIGVAFVMAAVVWVMGRVFGNHHAQRISAAVFIWCAIAAAVAGAGMAITVYFAGLNLGF